MSTSPIPAKAPKTRDAAGFLGVGVGPNGQVSVNAGVASSNGAVQVSVGSGAPIAVVPSIVTSQSFLSGGGPLGPVFAAAAGMQDSLNCFGAVVDQQANSLSSLTPTFTPPGGVGTVPGASAGGSSNISAAAVPAINSMAKAFEKSGGGSSSSDSDQAAIDAGLAAAMAAQKAGKDSTAQSAAQDAAISAFRNAVDNKHLTAAEAGNVAAAAGSAAANASTPTTTSANNSDTPPSTITVNGQTFYYNPGKGNGSDYTDEHDNLPIDESGTPTGIYYNGGGTFINANSGNAVTPDAAPVAPPTSDDEAPPAGDGGGD